MKSPSVSVTLHDSKAALAEVNYLLDEINKLTAEHNGKIDQKETFLKKIKTSFWDIMRWDYDQTISSLISDEEQSQKTIKEIAKSIQNYDAQIKRQKELIAKQERQTVNIEESITNINYALVDLGIEDVEIKKHSEKFYEIVRGQNDDKVFLSLSEGEKMIISFLYFIELCKGKKDSTESAKRKPAGHFHAIQRK